jgi:hypothetical protein
MAPASRKKAVGRQRNVGLLLLESLKRIKKQKKHDEDENMPNTLASCNSPCTTSLHCDVAIKDGFLLEQRF